MTIARLTRIVAAVTVGLALIAGAASPATGAPARTAHPVKPFSTNLIVVEKSIGGIRIGELASVARKSFPAKGCDSGQCTYNGRGYSAFFYFGAPKPGERKVVNDITIFASKFGTSAGLMRTDRGIGIGSTPAAVRKAYPKVRFSSKNGPFFIGSGKRNTVLTFFALDNANKHVAQVTVALQLGQ